jgi:Concanavalin A-like lectin/glucanases superfamily
MPEIPRDHSLDIALLGIHGTDLRREGIHGEFTLEPGNHLRWAIRSDLGLPKRFIVYRTAKGLDSLDGFRGILKQIGIPGIERVPELFTKYIEPTSIPIKFLEYQTWKPLEWLSQSSPNESELRAKFESSGQELTQAMSELFEVQPDWTDFSSDRIKAIKNMHQKIPNRPDGARHTTIKTLDAIQLAALDPYIARMVGLYFIDRTPGFDLCGYYVVADFEDRLWPLSFREPRKPNGYQLQTAVEDLDGVVVMAPVGRLFYDWSAELKVSLLTIRGFPVLRLRLRFPEPVQEVEITLEFDSPSANLSDVMVSPEGRKEVTPSNGAVQVLAITCTHQTDWLELQDTHTSTWIIRRIAWRRKSEVMGKLVSNCKLLDSRESNPAVPPPVLTRAVGNPSPLVLNHPGVVIPGLTDLRVSFKYGSEAAFASSTPVRMMYLRSDLQAETTQVVDEHLSVVNQLSPAIPELRLWMPLNESLTNQVNGRKAETIGQVRFRRTSRDPKAMKPLLLNGSAALALNEPDLKTPEGAFSIFARVKVDKGIPEGSHVPVFCCGISSGFSLGVQRIGDSCKTHVLINGNSFESSQAFPIRAWTRIGFAYEEGRLRLFVDAQMTELSTTFGLIAFHPGSIGIGATFERNPSEASHFFKGQISDVQFWKGNITWMGAARQIELQQNLLPQNLARTEMLSLPHRTDFHSADDTVRQAIPELGTSNTSFRFTPGFTSKLAT